MKESEVFDLLVAIGRGLMNVLGAVGDAMSQEAKRVDETIAAQRRTATTRKEERQVFIDKLKSQE